MQSNHVEGGAPVQIESVIGVGFDNTPVTFCKVLMLVVWLRLPVTNTVSTQEVLDLVTNLNITLPV